MKKTVLAFGSFDILHPGHIEYLREARRLGDRLIVVIARDESVRLFKKSDPVMKQDDRAFLVGSLMMVDKAVIGEPLERTSDVYNIFLKYRPDVIALGYDQRVDVEEMKRWLARHKIKAKIVRVNKRLDESWYKSSKVKARLLKTLS
jgi:FAD synthetase